MTQQLPSSLLSLITQFEYSVHTHTCFVRLLQRLSLQMRAELLTTEHSSQPTHRPLRQPTSSRLRHRPPILLLVPSDL